MLLVLSVLTLFMMLGAIMLVLATRARTTARAFANATSVAAVPAIQSQAVLDEALMILLRGSKGALPPQFTESLLEDRYGDATSGEAVAGSVSALTSCSPTLEAGPILTASIQNLSPAVTHPCDLNGRILTFKPDPGDGDIASYRILRATGATAPFTVYLANSPVGRIITLPKNKCSVVINGREFLNEAHDSHDKDAWLARVELTDSRVSVVPQASYGGASPSLECDNDNDGIADGVWMSGLIPDRPSPLGGTLQYQISYHVLDLDGRINLNAHGAPTAVTTGSTDWVSTSNGTNIANVPVGMGYGPADVDVSRLLSD